MKSRLQSIRGTKDIMPPESETWYRIEQHIRSMMRLFRYEEIRTPIFEDTTLFVRSIGGDTDIVGKEMYTFTDKGGTSLTLRPEMTASVIRAYVQHHIGEQGAIVKLFYIAPMFRQERPQAGRLRQFHQFGMESIGQENPQCDAEIIALASAIYTDLGLQPVLKINSVGDEHCRPVYRDALRSYFAGMADALSDESRRRIETNVLRILDSKEARDREVIQSAPNILDYLCDSCRRHFDAVTASLRSLNIPYTIDSRLVRGLDYYSKTAFEFVSEQLGAQDALGGGGRYDTLVQELGGKPTPAVGFAAGIERLLIVLEKTGLPTSRNDLFIYLIGLDPDSREWIFERLHEFRSHGWSCDMDYVERSFKAQMREANRLAARYVLIVGEEEMRSRTAIVRNMDTGEQVHVGFENLIRYFEKTNR